MGVFDRQIASAKRLIDKYGQSVQIKTLAHTIPNPAKPWESVDVPASPITVKMVFISPSSSGESLLGRQLLEYLKGTEVVTGQIRGLMAASSLITPKMSDVVLRDSKELKIKAVDTLAPNGQAILHTIEFEL